MMRQIQTLDDLIAAFGGPAAMASALSAAKGGRRITREAIYVWRKRGLPRRWALVVHREAATRNLPVRLEVVEGLCDPPSAQTTEAA